VGVTNAVMQKYTDYFFNSDELYPTKEQFDGRPEFALMRKANYTIPDDA